jgi:hypothetical protein
MHAAGLDPVRYVLTAGGIIAIHVGRKPEEAGGAPHEAGRDPAAFEGST